jgi:hypothetical protein
MSLNKLQIAHTEWRNAEESNKWKILIACYKDDHIMRYTTQEDDDTT